MGGDERKYLVDLSFEPPLAVLFCFEDEGGWGRSVGVFPSVPLLGGSESANGVHRNRNRYRRSEECMVGGSTRLFQYFEQ